jgi:hypothetical protein
MDHNAVAIETASIVTPNYDFKSRASHLAGNTILLTNSGKKYLLNY